MLYYRILWGNAIQKIWCPVELVRRHARGASPTKLRFSAIATDRRGILPSVCLQTPVRLRKGPVCIRDFFDIGQTWVGPFFCCFLLFNSPLPSLCGLDSARRTLGVWRHYNTCQMFVFARYSFPFMDNSCWWLCGAKHKAIWTWSSGMTNFDKDAYLGQWYEYANVFEFYQDLPCK